MTKFAGTGGLLRLALRRDRFMLPGWVAIFVVACVGSAAATVGLFPTVASRVQVAETANASPALVALYGWIYDPSSLGAIALAKMGSYGIALVAILTAVTVVRHTRADEEAGRLELLSATVVGRYAAVTSALLTSVATSLVLGAATALGLMAAGLPAAGSVAFGAAWAGAGVAFAAVAAVAAQLTQGSRAANGLAICAVGVAYLLRAFGDAAGDHAPTWPTWVSPIGWAQQVRPFAGDRWWALLPLLGLALALTGWAYALVARRDVSAGLLPDRPGRATAAASLRSPLALAWRLQRGSLYGWLCAFVVLGLVFGSVVTQIGSAFDNPQSRKFLTQLGGEQGMNDAFLATVLGLIGVIASAYGVQAALRLRSEESALHAEQVLATAVGRVRWAGSHLVVALLGTTVLLAGAGLATGVAYAADAGEPGLVGRVLAAALVQLPATWVLTGVVVALFGLVPRLAAASWGVLVAFLLLGELGPLLRLDQRVMDVSPYAHTPQLPSGEVTATPLVALVAIAAALTLIGLAAFRRRDLA